MPNVPILAADTTTASGKRVPLLSADVEVDDNNLWRGPATSIVTADGETVQTKLDVIQENVARLAVEMLLVNQFERIDYNAGTLQVTGSMTIPAGKYYKFDAVDIEPEGHLTNNGILITKSFTNNGVFVDNGATCIIQ